MGGEGHGRGVDLARAAKTPMPLAGPVDQLVKTINQERMKALLG